jgi:hypothetical protein
MSKESSTNPWPVTLAKLASLEHQIQDTDKEGMLKRWEFGHELMKRRVPNPVQKKQQIVPPELMALTIKQCGISRQEISYRIQFAERYPTKKDASTGVEAHPSWIQMKNSFKKKRTTKPRAKNVVQSIGFTLKKLKQVIAKAQTQHATLTREEVQDVEDLLKSLTQLLDQIDQNDAVKADRKVS